MKTLKFTILLLSIWTTSYGQDGSDIRYFKTNGVDSSLVGQYVHIDFFKRSFHGRPIDTVTIIIDNRPTRFIEIRKDDGYNNWFFQQRLQSIDKLDGQTIKISKFKLDSITATSFQVTMYVDFYGSDNKLLDDKSQQIEYWFDKKDITEVLVKSKQL
jgi:hypothetical protein